LKYEIDLKHLNMQVNDDQIKQVSFIMDYKRKQDLASCYFYLGKNEKNPE
jgi:hypothetical protein